MTIITIGLLAVAIALIAVGSFIEMTDPDRGLTGAMLTPRATKWVGSGFAVGLIAGVLVLVAFLTHAA